LDNSKSHPIRRRLAAILPPPRLSVRSDEGAGPTIILLHGIAASSDHWQNLLPMLTPRFRCVAIDLLGFGRSPKPRWSEYTIADQVRSLHATLRALRLRGPVIIIGHSLGSLIATRYAAAYPKQVSRLVLLSPPIYLQPSQISAPAARGLINIYLAAYRYLREHKQFALANANVIRKMLDFEGALELDESTWQPFVRSLEHCIESQTFISDIARVRAPIDVFYGGLDQFLVKDNLQILAAIRGVTLHPVLIADHVLRKGYCAAVAAELD
jgi:pimeloyl-ACP methyl ester carboxylesterase